LRRVSSVYLVTPCMRNRVMTRLVIADITQGAFPVRRRDLSSFQITSRSFSGGQDRDKWGVFTDPPGRAMINYSPPPREVLHMLRVRAGQASDQQR